MIPVRVGNSILDHDHAELSCLLEDLHALWINRCGGAAILTGLIRFEEVLCAHFAVEEAILRGCAYAGLAHHQAQHRAFLTEVAHFRRQLSPHPVTEGERPLHAFDIASRLSDLLYAHELVEDSAYVPALLAPPAIAAETIDQSLTPLVQEAAALKTRQPDPMPPTLASNAPALTPQAAHALSRLIRGLAGGELVPEQIATEFLPYWLEKPATGA
ncbi:bacteriohemerythrin [Novispirillum itersonii]|uniref:bacteriohemerythrin n=1 Tax=Novispirillum itersonii TaxID=189 RepID=UPI00035DFBD5|nr:hemerythrin family protein [Novispirillum itersonii]